jgi:hypothetical protein
MVFSLLRVVWLWSKERHKYLGRGTAIEGRYVTDLLARGGFCFDRA